MEASISDEFNAPVAASDLPTRALSGVVVFEEATDALFLRDLDMLDEPQPPTLDVVGRLTKLGDEGEPLEAAEPGVLEEPPPREVGGTMGALSPPVRSPLA